MEKKTDALGIVGMILGIIGLVVGIFWTWGLLLGIPALILGTIGFTKKDTSSKGFSIASLTLGAVGTTWFIIVLTIALVIMAR